MSASFRRFSLFPTPVFVLDAPVSPSVREELARRFADESKQVAGIQRSNVGGWHSVPDLALRREPIYQQVLQSIVETVSAVTKGLAREGGYELAPFGLSVQAWAMVLHSSDYVSIHDHGDSHWSIAYYIDAGDDVGGRSGHLGFVDPRRSGRSIPGIGIFQPEFFVKPQTGMLVVFPGWLQHFVHAYRGERPRIVLSANLSVIFDQPIMTDG